MRHASVVAALIGLSLTVIVETGPAAAADSAMAAPGATGNEPAAACPATTEAQKVAQSPVGMKRTDPVGSPVEMRASDHQLLMPYYASSFSKKVKYDSEKTGFGWATDFTATTEDLTLPTTCKMKRPT